MKRSWAATLIILLISCGAYTQAQDSPQVIFDQANTYLEKGELNEAKNLYKAIEKSNFESGALYLNLGIVYTQQDSMGMAKFYFLKASEFEETSSKAQLALEYVNSQFSRQSAILPKLPWDKAIDWINKVPTATGVYLTGFGITLLGLIPLYLSWFKISRFYEYHNIIVTLIVTGALIAGLAFYADYVNQRYNGAVVVVKQKQVHQSPEDNSSLISLAYEGYDITVDQWMSQEQNQWYYIRLGNGQYGWVQQNGIKIL